MVYFAFSIYAAALPAHAVVDIGWSANKLGVLYVTIGIATFYVSAAAVALATCLFVAAALRAHPCPVRP